MEITETTDESVTLTANREAGPELDAQYRELRESAGYLLRERSFQVVQGAEAAEYLQGQLTNDIEAVAEESGCYAALLDRKGHMQSDARVLCISRESFLIDTEPDGAAAMAKHLTMYSVGRELTIGDVTDEHTAISVIGPAAFELSGIAPLSAEYDHREVDVDGVGARAIRTDVGLDLICDPSDAPALGKALETRGIATVSEDAAEIIRVEHGRPRFGAEMTTRTIPQEADINERAVSFTKGCYIGQETVARLHYKGKPNRHLRGLRLAEMVDAGSAIRLGEKELGDVGTAVLSPAFGPIALAIVRREGEVGTHVTVGDGVEAEVVELPFLED